MSNLYDFDPALDRVPLDRLQEVDRFAVGQYGVMAKDVLSAYDRYDYPSIFQTVNQFVTVDLSAFYADVAKDRLYTFAASSPERRSAQTAMYIMADGLSRLLAPILPVTSDELWRHLPAPSEPSVHLSRFPEQVDDLIDTSLANRWERLLAVRDEVNRALEVARQNKVIGTSLGAFVTLSAGGELGQLLREHEAELPMLCIVSQIALEPGDIDQLRVTVSRADGDKCQRCWRVVPDVSQAAGGVCSRCSAALDGAAQAAR